VTTPAGRGQPLIYIDYDGTLHHERCLWDESRGPYLDAPNRYSLFQHAPLLEELLEPHPTVLIILSTSWAQKIGFKEAVRRLPAALQARVIGATYELAAPGDHFGYLSRGEQVLLDVERRRPSSWLALDDDVIGWPKWALEHLAATDPYEGLSPQEVRLEIRRKLAKLV
jgi:hypothetical protein